MECLEFEEKNNLKGNSRGASSEPGRDLVHWQEKSEAEAAADRGSSAGREEAEGPGTDAALPLVCSSWHRDSSPSPRRRQAGRDQRRQRRSARTAWVSSEAESQGL